MKNRTWAAVWALAVALVLIWSARPSSPELEAQIIVPSTTAPVAVAPANGVTGAGVVTAPLLTMPTVAFAALGTPANGTMLYCSDCTETTPASCPVTQASCICTNAGAGAFARRVGGAWYCTF